MKTVDGHRLSTQSLGPIRIFQHISAGHLIGPEIKDGAESHDGLVPKCFCDLVLFENLGLCLV